MKNSRNMHVTSILFLSLLSSLALEAALVRTNGYYLEDLHDFQVVSILGSLADRDEELSITKDFYTDFSTQDPISYEFGFVSGGSGTLLGRAYRSTDFVIFGSDYDQELGGSPVGVSGVAFGGAQGGSRGGQYGTSNFIPIVFQEPSINDGNNIYGFIQMGFFGENTLLIEVNYSDSGKAVVLNNGSVQEIPEVNSVSLLFLGTACCLFFRHSR